MMIMEYIETASTAWGSPQVPVPSPCDTSLHQRMMGPPLPRARFERSDCSHALVTHTITCCVPPAIERGPAAAPGQTPGVARSNMLEIKVLLRKCVTTICNKPVLFTNFIQKST